MLEIYIWKIESIGELPLPSIIVSVPLVPLTYNISSNKGGQASKLLVIFSFRSLTPQDNEKIYHINNKFML